MTDPTKQIHISIDLETMSTASNAGIVQIGAVALLGSAGNHEYSQYIDPKSSEKAGLDISTETINWWSKQDADLRARVFGGTAGLVESLEDFTEWCRDVSSNRLEKVCLWSKGADFDLPILRSAYETYRTYPFVYYNHRCVRTLMAMFSEADLAKMIKYGPYRTALTPHNALDDAKAQANFIQRGYLDFLPLMDTIPVHY